MNKIFYLIPFFLMLGCSTPSINIPSYDFSADNNSTSEDILKKEAATTEVASIEDAVDNNISTEEIAPIVLPEEEKIEIENVDTTTSLPKIKIEEVSIPTLPASSDLTEEEAVPTDNLALPDHTDINETTTIKEELPKQKVSTETIEKSAGFFSFFSKKPKVKNQYFTGGKIRSKLVMSDDSGESGLLYRYGYEGKITSTVHLKHGIKNGLETLFDAKGKVMKRTPFVNGKKDGIVEVYYADGKVLAQIAYVNDKRHGRASKYNHDGTTNEEVQYTHGKIEIPHTDVEIPIID